MPPAHLSAPKPLRLAPTLKGGQAFRWRPLAAAQGEQEAWLGIAEGHAWRVAREDGHLQVQAWPDLPVERVEAWARRYLRLGDDYAAMGARLRKDPELGEAMDAWWGLRLLQTEPWECLLGFVTSIHDSVGAIETRIARLCRHFGEPFRVPAALGTRGWAHGTPTPERIARAHEARLRSAAGMGFRAKYLRGAARMAVQGDLPLAELPAMGYEEAHEVLLQVPGVGDKVADCIQLYALGHLDSFPVDRHILRVMQGQRFAGPKARPKAIVDLARARWGPDAGYAQQFLFHHARLGARATSTTRRSTAR